MRLAITAFALVGCGRLGFDPQVDSQLADGASVDGPQGALVQARGNGCAFCSSVTVTLASAVATGDALVAFLYTCAPGDVPCATPTIADDLGHAWSVPMITGAPGTGADYVWYVCGASAGSVTITATNDSATYGMSLHVHEVSGVAATGCFDTMGTSSGTGAMASVTTSAPLARPNEYVAAFFGNNASFGPVTYTEGPGYSIAATTLTTGNDAAMSEAAVPGAVTGQATASATRTSPGATWHAFVAAFR